MQSNPTVLIADDDADIRLALELLLVSNNYTVIHAQDPMQVEQQMRLHQPALILLDMNFSRDTTSGAEGLALLDNIASSAIPIILMTAWGSINLAVDGLKRGACDFFEKPWNKDKLLNSIAQQLEIAQLKQEHAGYKQLLSAPKRASYPEQENTWVCQSSSMQAIEQLVNQVAETDANVLILGDNGTGKSHLAERIHQQSIRRNQPFIAVNMAAIPDNLFESELFGHQKGAFTDAKQQRVGRFKLADKGTLFFDEIGSLPVHLQPKLLRVLETGQYEVLGSSATLQSNVRLISATNANLSELVAKQAFRQDLLYRLNTFVITMPSLRDRLEDLAALTQQFIHQFCDKYHKTALTLSTQALDKLKTHSWPGNVRELSHVIERAVLMSSNGIIEAQALLLEATHSEPSIQLQTLEEAEKQLIEKALNVSDGNIIDAAKILGISRNALYRRIEKYNTVLMDTSPNL